MNEDLMRYLLRNMDRIDIRLMNNLKQQNKHSNILLMLLAASVCYAIKTNHRLKKLENQLDSKEDYVM